ncbi:NAD(FAD)-Dependent Dehydrogenase [Agrobacterium tumefaciens]|nr:NAD(FAD)-Dependent Dehydrogenase [Agrobacterium tumefaciens]
MARAHDELVGRLVRTGALALRGLAPRSNRVATTRRATFTTTVRVVDRVHDDAANVRTLAAPTGTTGLAVVDVGVVRVRNSTDRCEAGAVHQTLFARVETQDGHAGITADELDIRAGGPSDLTALARLHLDVMDDRTDRNVLKRHGVAGLHVHCLLGGDHLVTSSETLWRENVSLFAVGIRNQRDERGAVGVVFQTFNGAFNVELATLEVNQTVGPLVTATLETDGDPALVVTATLGAEALGESLYRLALVERSAVHDNQLTLAWRGRIETFQCHFLVPFWVFARLGLTFRVRWTRRWIDLRRA